MPIYRYEVINKDGSSGETFEMMQGISEPPLEKHPKTGQPVRRVFGAPNIGGPHSESAVKSALSEANLERTGFTKYQRVGKGQYERKTGSFGPKQISAK